MLPLFKKSHIHSRHVEDLLKTGHIRDYATENNKRNALRQASLLYRIIDGELFRHGTEREYNKYGLRLVVHDDQPEKKAEIIAKCHLDDIGNHYGMNNTIRNVCDTYYWQGISAHVKMYLKQCEQCKNRSKFNAEEWLELERKNIDKKKALAQVMNEAQQEIKNLGRVKKPTPPETFFIVNAERKVDFVAEQPDGCMMIDSNNIEYVVETLGQSDGMDLEEVCHVLNVPDIVPIPERFRSREIETFLRDGTYPHDFTSNMKCGLRGPAAQYKLIDDELYHEGNKAGSKGMRMVIHDDLPALKVKVMVECHIDEDGSHYGLNKTLNKIGEKYHWVGMSVDARKFMMHCKICSEQRGRKALFDDKEYEQEAQEVKSRHLKKMNETEASGSDMELTAMPVSYDSTDIEPTEGLEQEGHQVIRLIGPNKEVTEITVAVVNQETVTADGMETNQIVQGSENDGELQVSTGEAEKGRSLVTKEMTDAVAQIEAAEAAMEMAGLKQQDVKAEVVENSCQDEKIVKKEKSEEILVMKTEADEDDNVESEKGDSQEEQTNSGEKSVVNGTVAPESKVAQMETEDGVVNVFIIKEGENSHEETEEVTTIVEGDENVGTVESDGMVVLTTGEEHTWEEVARQNESANNAFGLFSYYKDVICVPEMKKTRIIENFLKLGARTQGFSQSRLLEMSENFEIVDDVLYRRPSRYKGRQIVIHDDIPELKFKIISELHLKRNGQHCSELITFQSVSFKYYWEELKWDVHRWYATCTLCVNESGIERKSNKRILTVAEQKRRLEEKKRESRVSGANAVRSRDCRNRNRHQFDKFVIVDKYDTGHYAQVLQVSDSELKKVDGTQRKVMVKVEGGSTNEDSDVEIHIPEADDGGRPRVVKVRKRADLNVLYDLAVYATLEQEQCIKDMYVQKHWSYDPISFTKASSEDDDDDDDDCYYLLSLKVTAFQENAIKELFQSMGLVIEASEAPKPLNLQTLEQHIQKIHPNSEEKEPVTNKVDELIKHLEPGTKKEEGLIDTWEPVLKTQESAAQTEEPAFQEQEAVHKKMETTKTPMQVLQKGVKVSESVAVKQSVVQAPMKVGSQGQQTESSPDAKRTSVTVPVVRSIMKKPIEKIESPGPSATQPPTPKRKISSILSPVTPVTETRRSRREIKRPRRFSPDSSPHRLVTVKIEPDSPKSDRENEVRDTEPQRKEIASRSTNMEKESSVNINVESLPKKNVQVIPKAGTLRSTRSTRLFPESNVARNLRSRSEAVKELKEVIKVEETKIGEGQEDKQKAKVSIMSKGRIRVKKIPMENNLHLQTKTGAKSSESNEGDIEMTENSKVDLKKDCTGKEQAMLRKDENVKEKDEDSDDDDDDDDYDDDEGDDDDDDMDVTEETEDMKVPLTIILDDTIDSMEAIESEGGYVCSLCNAKFRNKNLCVQHGQKKMCFKKCESCGKMYKKKDVEQYKDHVELHKNGQNFSCTDCEKIFFNEEHLKIHLRSHKNEVVTNCSRCRKEFYTWFQYASHMVHKHNDCNMFACDVCNAKFASISFMKSEVKFDGNLSYFKCIMCS